MLTLLLALGALAAPCAAHALLPLANASGEALYLRECAPCHGPAGHGDGPEAATFRNKPRDVGDLARAEPSPRIIERVRRSRLRMLEIDEDVVVERQKRIVEDLVTYVQRMPDVPWLEVHRGADVYAERCETCHGPNARPVAASLRQRAAQPGGAAPARDFQKAHGDPELLAMAQGQGHPALPGFAPVMNEDDATALLAYLRNLSDGFVAYSLWCAGCHGDEGKGDGPLATGIDKPPVVFNHVYMVTQSPEELRRKVMHVFADIEPATPHFQRNLSEGQTRAVLAAVRTLQAEEGGAAPVTAVAAKAATSPAVSPTVVATAPSTGMPASMPAAVATMIAPPAPAATPVAPSLAAALAQHAPSAVSAAPVAATPAAATAAPATSAAVATSAATPAATPGPSVSRTPSPSRTPVALRTAAVKAAKPKSAVTRAPAGKAVKPKATPKPAGRTKPKAKATPAKKAAAPRATASPEVELAP